MNLGAGIDIDLHSVLERQPLPIDERALRDKMAGRRVLVTGAGGSIGACLAAMLVRWRVSELILVDNHEHSLYELQSQLGRAPGRDFYLADIRRPSKIARLFAHHKPDVVFHLAAYKHVPLGEENPDEAFATNVLGTLNIVRAASECGVETVAYSSTDKAVYPPSVYGATKRLVELLLAAYAAEAVGPRAGVVRLVNAVGAQGGVIRIFARQIMAGQPLTITDERMTRFWISIEEAASLVAQAACLDPSVSMIVPAVGPATQLTAVASRLQAMLRPATDLSFDVTGMRPGERLHELLTRDDETLAACPHPGVIAVRATEPKPVSLGSILTAIASMEERATEGDAEALRGELFDFVGRQGIE